MHTSVLPLQNPFSLLALNTWQSFSRNTVVWRRFPRPWYVIKKSLENIPFILVHCSSPWVCLFQLQSDYWEETLNHT